MISVTPKIKQRSNYIWVAIKDIEKEFRKFCNKLGGKFEADVNIEDRGSFTCILPQEENLGMSHYTFEGVRTLYIVDKRNKKAELNLKFTEETPVDIVVEHPSIFKAHHSDVIIEGLDAHAKKIKIEVKGVVTDKSRVKLDVKIE